MQQQQNHNYMNKPLAQEELKVIDFATGGVSEAWVKEYAEQHELGLDRAYLIGLIALRGVFERLVSPQELAMAGQGFAPNVEYTFEDDMPCVVKVSTSGFPELSPEWVSCYMERSGENPVSAVYAGQNEMYSFKQRMIQFWLGIAPINHFRNGQLGVFPNPNPAGPFARNTFGNAPFGQPGAPGFSPNFNGPL